MRNKKLLALLGSVVLVLVLVALPFMAACAKPAPTPAAPVPPAAKPFPSKTITWMVAYAAGGGHDQQVRIASTGFLDAFGVNCHVLNMAGASGIVGWKWLLDQPADGYTLIMNSVTPLLAMAREEKPPFSPNDFKPVCAWQGKGSPAVLFTRPDAPWATWEKFKAYVTENPGKLTVGGTGVNRMAGWYVLGQAGLRDKVTWVPYDSVTTASTDMLGGHLDTVIGNSPNLEVLWPSKAVGIVCLSPESGGVPCLEGIPNATDLGYIGLFTVNNTGVHPDTPDEIVDILARGFEKLCQDKNIALALKNIGVTLEFVPRAEATKSFMDTVKAAEEVVKTGFM